MLVSALCMWPFLPTFPILPEVLSMPEVLLVLPVESTELERLLPTEELTESIRPILLVLPLPPVLPELVEAPVLLVPPLLPVPVVSLAPFIELLLPEEPEVFPVESDPLEELPAPELLHEAIEIAKSAINTVCFIRHKF